MLRLFTYRANYSKNYNYNCNANSRAKPSTKPRISKARADTYTGSSSDCGSDPDPSTNIFAWFSQN